MGETPVLAGPDGTPRTETRTFLFTDLEGSTTLVRALGDEHPALAEHLDLLRATVRDAGGEVFGSAGDAIFAAFRSAPAAVGAAAAAQRALAHHRWPDGVAVAVRIGIDTGEAVVGVGDYSGLALHRVARIESAAWGGQVLLSERTAALVGDRLPAGVSLRDLGEHRLKDLDQPERLLQLVIDGLRDGFPPPRTTAGGGLDLPPQLTTFVGREADVAAVARLLDEPRIVTLVGPGGTGKTRLAIEVAGQQADRFLDGVVFVPLAAVAEPDLVASAVIAALGMQEAGRDAPEERLLQYLADREQLLVLDNFEQVLAAAPLVARLAATSRATLLVTSRAPLRVSGEQVYEVPPLGFVPVPVAPAPADQAAGSPAGDVHHPDAVRLFVDRARAVRPDFTLDDRTARCVEEIVARLDGLPLAIELAAARVRLLSPQQIAERLHGRLGLLGQGPRDRPARQRTLRNAIAWSYELLDGAARDVFAAFAVFVGGARLEEIEAVCADGTGLDVLDALSTLVDHSLVRSRADRAEPRFEMLETIREFASEQLAASGAYDAVASRFARVQLAIAEEAAPHLTGQEQARWLDRLEDEIDNLRAVLSWAATRGETEIALRLFGAVWRMWQIRGHLFEGRRRAEQVLRLADADAHGAASALAYEAAGGIAYWQGETELAEGWYARSLELHRATGDQARVANALYNLAFVHAFGGDGPRDPDRRRESDTLLGEALDLHRASGDRRGEATVLWGLGDLAYWSGAMDQARAALEPAIAIFREVAEPFGLGWGLYMLGGLETACGDLDRARSLLLEALGLFVTPRDLSGVVLVLDGLAQEAQVRGEPRRALRIATVSASLREATGTELVTRSAAIEPGRHVPGVGLTPGDAETIAAEARAEHVDDLVTELLADASGG
jgi:predicted ATPase/class 3 adenylate cyclase